MPELPEVETVVRDLRGLLVGQPIDKVQVYWEGSIGTPSPAQFRSQLQGQHIVAISRRGKYIIFRLDRGDLLVHLRMTGQLLVQPARAKVERSHVRVALTLDGQRLLFNDVRKFGRMYLVSSAESMLAKLGPEPLEDLFTVQALAALVGGRRGAIKCLLLNQEVIAGIGNIYADEALHVAGIAPQRKACTLSETEIAALHSAIRSELARGIRDRGTTFSSYRDAKGERGEHREHLRAYGRAGQACRRCGATIVRSRIGGRSSFHCPCCQV